MPTRVEQDDLHLAADRSERVHDLRAGLLAQRAVGRFVEEVEQQSLTFDLVRFATIATTRDEVVVVIIPRTRACFRRAA